MTGREAIDYFYSTAPDPATRRETGLLAMQNLMRVLGNPHYRFASIHVAGTNGKGSIAAYMATTLSLGGYKVGLYTSPYLEKFNERIRIAGKPVDDETLADAAEQVREAERKILKAGSPMPTPFDRITAAGFLIMADAGVDIAIVEVGLGGQFDSTNVLTPVVSVIGRIGMDHTRILGNTLEEIAAAKAGIIKRGVPVVLYPACDEVRRVVEEMCRQKDTSLYTFSRDDVQIFHSDCRCVLFDFFGDEGGYLNLELGIPGDYQAYNAAAAIVALEQTAQAGFPMATLMIHKGLKAARWPGRMEWLGRILLDGAHNPQGAEALARNLKGWLQEKPVLICGILGTKDYAAMVKIFASLADQAVCVCPEEGRGLEPEALAELFSEEGVEAFAEKNAEAALKKAGELAGNGPIVVCGSLYLVGQTRTLIRENKQ